MPKRSLANVVGFLVGVILLRTAVQHIDTPEDWRNAEIAYDVFRARASRPELTRDGSRRPVLDYFVATARK